MTIRALTALVMVAICGTDVLAQQNAPRSGEHIVLQMAGDLAKEYGRRTGSPQESLNTPGLQIETVAMVTQTLDDGRIRIEHSYPVQQNGKPSRLVTLTVTAAPAKVTTNVIPKGTPVFASPTGREPRFATEEETRTLRIELSDLQGVKLRTWSFVDEIGD